MGSEVARGGNVGFKHQYDTSKMGTHMNHICGRIATAC